MKNIYEVLREKERSVVRLRDEVEALRLVAPLLAEHDSEASTSLPDMSLASALQRNKWPLDVGNPGPTYLDS